MVDLKEDFELAAEWRRAVAVEHPSDNRNLKAAAMLDQLAETVAAINPNVLATYQEIFEGGPGDDSGFHALEDKREMMNRIGFHYFPATAEEFCRNSHFKTHRRPLTKRANPPPELHNSLTPPCTLLM